MIASKLSNVWEMMRVSVQSLAQMNIRLGNAVKDAGDAVLAQEGTSPTQLVRALWEKIARGAADLRQVEEILGMRAQDAMSTDEGASKIDAMNRGRRLYANAIAELGITAIPSESLEDGAVDVDRYADAMVTRMQERGVW